MVASAKEQDCDGRDSLTILYEVLNDKCLRKALVMGCVLLSVQQLTGESTNEQTV